LLTSFIISPPNRSNCPPTWLIWLIRTDHIFICKFTYWSKMTQQTATWFLLYLLLRHVLLYHNMQIKMWSVLISQISHVGGQLDLLGGEIIKDVKQKSCSGLLGHLGSVGKFLAWNKHFYCNQWIFKGHIAIDDMVYLYVIPCYAIPCIVYGICVSLRIVVSDTYCVVF
jgi:hypothetical protein